MAQLDFVAPTSVEDAVRALVGAPGARVLAGGTDLIVQMRSGRTKPRRIVDLKRIPGAIGVRREAGGGFTIGAATPGAALSEDAALVKAWPGVVEAANQMKNASTASPVACSTANIMNGCIVSSGERRACEPLENRASP